MDSHFYHIQLNIDFANLPFYKSLFEFVGWSTIFEAENIIGFKSATNGDIWFSHTPNSSTQNYDALGMNHLALKVSKQTDINDIHDYLTKNKIESRFETPRHRPEFAGDESETYYQVMFESPDKILFEFVYVGKKN